MKQKYYICVSYIKQYQIWTMGIGVFSGSLIEVHYATNIRIDGGELLYNDIEELSGSYEYVNVD